MSSHMSAEEYIAAMHQDNQALRAENERLKERNALLEKVAEAAQDILWVFDCTCIEAYTDRGLHEPNAICGEGDGLSAALAALELK